MDLSRYEPEADRLAFLVDRDGLEGAKEFAQRTKVSYRRKVLENKFISTEMKLRYVRAYLAFKRFTND